MMLAIRLDRKPLILKIVLALAFGLPIWLLGSLTQNAVLDGAIGVLLGLFICSLPARNAIDVVFANRFVPGQIWRSQTGKIWIGLNGLTVLAGWTTILLGMVQLAG